jgi:DNA-binding FadR family transcriptional regulator
MNALLDAANAIIHHGDPAGELRQVDRYIMHYNRAPSKFVLPRKHAHLGPLVASYALSPYPFLTLVRYIRDQIKEIQGDSLPYQQVQEFQRRLKGRLAQSERRARASRLNAWMTEHRKDLTARQRLAWIRQIEDHWLGRRIAIESDARRHAGGLLTEEELAQLREAHWEQIEQQITAGQFPPFREGE